jgi:hypothetical protein
MSTIKLEIDSTDSIVCGAFAAAFQTLASGGNVKEKEPESTVLDCDKISKETEVPSRLLFGTDLKPTLDLPHDSRIHSSGKVKNQDGTWKYARKPKDKTPDEWKEYITQVESELEQLMTIPVPETISHEELDKVAVEPEVEKVEPELEAEPIAPPPPAEAPKDIAPPPPAADEEITFADIMKVAASKCGIDIANKVVESMGVPAPFMPNLKKRDDLYPEAMRLLTEAVENK